ncbi:plasma-membrane choline transporter-domain-containing protein [Aspergillus stella-maris]|uniref:plasma-membrane choline transporter-domain-containing protein n=1 Tax=Aspergillus stella-maris TaxID=1810926 RepID=UPI003CCD274D
MVTGNGALRYPPQGPMGGHDLAGRRRIPNPPRLDPLRSNPPYPRPSTADGLRPPRSSSRPRAPQPQPYPPQAPRSPRKYPGYPLPPRVDSTSRPVSPAPRPRPDDGFHRPTYHKRPITPHDRRPPPDADFDRYPRQTPPSKHSDIPLSISTARLEKKRSKPRLAQPPPTSHGLAIPPRSPYSSRPPNPYGDEVRSSVNSAKTSRSSIEHASGTERSSVLTKSSSITDLSPDTPDGYDKDDGMSVEDAISMYLDGFSDVTEEPGSPDLVDDAKVKPLSPLPRAELALDDLPEPSSELHSIELPPPPRISQLSTPEEPYSNKPYFDTTHTEENPLDPPNGPLATLLEQTSPNPDLDPQGQNELERQFLGETNASEDSVDEPAEPTVEPPVAQSPPRESKVMLPGIVPPPLSTPTETRDCYGFRKATSYVTIQQYEVWNASYSGFAANRKAKWAELLRENGLPANNPTKFPQKSDKVKRFVRKGIPAEYRGAAWFWYAGGYEHLNRNPGLYDQLVRQAMQSPGNDDKEHIERDLHRTFPDNIHFKPEQTGHFESGSAGQSVVVETEMIRSLRRVLYAFAIHNPQIGYTQSLNFITGLFLLFLPEEKAFWMLHIVTSVLLPSTHEISLEGANIDLWILMVLLKETSPNVYNKIADQGTKKNAPLSVNSRLPDITLGLTNWLMSIFIGTLPLETALRVWDAFFYEGSKTFFRISMAVFKACEKDIMAVSDPMEVFQVVQTVPKKLLDANALLDASFVRRNRVGQGRIDELRAARRAAVRQDQLRRSQAMNLGQLHAATDQWPTRSRTPIPGLERTFADSWRSAASYYNPEQSFQQPGYANDSNGYNGYNQNPPNPGYNANQPGYNPGYQYNGNNPPPEPKPPQDPPTYNEAVYGFDDAFKVDRPKYNDLWAGLLLIAVFLGYVAVSGVAIYRYSKYKGFNGTGIYDSDNSFSLDTDTLVLFIFVLCVALAFSWGYFLAARHFPKFFIWATGILNIVFALATGIYYIARKQYGGGIVFLIFGVFAIICFISWIPRIPFTAFMLTTSMDVSRKYGHMFIVSAIGGIVSVAFAAWFSVTLVSIYVAFEPASTSDPTSNPSCPNGSDGCSRARVIGLLVYVTFAMYWFSEWIKNTTHTTIAGVYGSWYFFANSSRGLPAHATRSAFKRATTYSFGSISFGSLIIAIINCLRQACSIAQRHEAAEGNLLGSIAFWVLGCFISLLDWLVTFFNRYAFCHIALYGKPYIASAKDTWTMMKDRGVDALVADCLIGPVITMGSVFVSYVCALLAYLYLQFTNPAYNSGGDFTAVIMAFAFVMGLQICQILMTPVSSGVETIFAAMAWDPQVMINEHPELWGRLVQLYPRVQTAVHA